MIPAISIVGHSKSGKTTLIELLIREFKKRGRRVAAVKHAHEDFDLDHPGKDSWRFGEAGSESVTLLGARRSAVMRSHPPGYAFDELLSSARGDADIMLIEGMSSGPYPKIEMHRGELGRELRCEPAELLAVVTDEPLEIGCKQFSLQEIGAIANLVEEHLAKRSPSLAALQINGKRVSLGPFTQKILANTILGIVKSLKGISKINTVSVLIRAADDVSDDAGPPS
jgi:molybdopterin-guanine dinucleotide biosynthesis protein MobB